ncbi:rna-directed dna polymerase from mobile element jockey-like [Limosa lapponica baueri]|uniref:Rna-directed dna polymerase from mobile element jockey-like n=1 Tax=Limosa lapponica baueri TaxID=1758121 RepID=A0A2I0UKT7_LIMLA|nr:rna-directed dna polymerase from mobile element jockey-like [Limosa lapponica baueri]
MIWMMGQHTLSKFADDTKPGGVAEMPEGHAAIQRDHIRLEKWSDRNILKFNKGKCKALHLERNSPTNQCMLEAAQLESHLVEKHLGDLGDTKLTISQ